MFRPLESPVGALMAVWVDAPPEIKPAFDEWYDTEHLPERRDCPGFLSAFRCEAIDGSAAQLALYELASPEVLQSAPYLALRYKPLTELGSKVRTNWKNHCRVDYRLRAAFGRKRIDAPFVYTVRLFPAPGHEAELRKWLDTEYAERLLGVPGCVSTHAFEPLSGAFHFLNVWGLENSGVPVSRAWQTASRTPRREQLAPYSPRSIEGIYRRA